MTVAYPFSIRKDILETKTYSEGSLESKLSEVQLFFETEEGEVEHIPEYGVKKRDLLFNAELDDAVLGVMLLRFQEKVNVWFKDVEVKDIVQVAGSSEDNKKITLAVLVNYGGQDGTVEVSV